MTASVGPFVTWERCQATIWSRQRPMVRPSRRTSSGISVVGEVADDLVDPLDGELVVGVVVDLADDLFGVPGEPHLPLRVAGGEQSEQLVVAVDAEPFAGHHQPPRQR